MSHKYHPHPEDQQQPQTGKVENDSNKQGNQAPTQKNEGQRTPQSRHDREAHIGNNQSHMRQGGPNQGNTGNSGNTGGQRG